MNSEFPINAIMSMDDHRGISKSGLIPWVGLSPVLYDLARFKMLTLNGICIMGRKTFMSLPMKSVEGRKYGWRGLSQRDNFVVGSSQNISIIRIDPQDSEFRMPVPYPRIFDSPVEALTEAIDQQVCTKQKIWIIGGGQIYSQLLKYTDMIYATKILGNWDCDTYFPYFEDQFKVVTHEIGPDPMLSFVTYKRITI